MSRAQWLPRRATKPKMPLSLIGVALFFALGLLGPLLAPYAPLQIDLLHAFQVPFATSAHPLGTADNGIDLLSAILHGARVACIVGVSVVGFCASFGTLIGMLAASLGGWVDDALGALMDLLQAFPGIILNIALLAIVAEASLVHVIAALCIPGWVLYARLARGKTLALLSMPYIEAAEVLGASRSNVLFKHLLPNLAGPIIVQASAGFGGVVLVEATLSFLGLGPAENVSWGMLLDQGTGALMIAPHVAILSGLAIALTVLSFNRAGDHLRDRWVRS